MQIIFHQPYDFIFERLTARFTEMDIDLVKRGADPFSELMFTLFDGCVLQCRFIMPLFIKICFGQLLDRPPPLFYKTG